MSVPSGMLPITTTTTQSGSSSGTNQAQGTNASTDLNVYSPQQQAAQGQVLSGLGNYLSTGNIPSYFGLPQSVRDMAWHDFNQQQAPMLAAQHGAGSPAIGAMQEDLNMRLNNLQFMNQQQAFLGAYGLAGNYAFQPEGATHEGQAQNQGAQQNQWNQTTNQATENWGNVVGGLLQMAANLPPLLFP